MYVAHLSLHDFRSYPALEVDLEPGVTSFVGRNGHGKTNIVEAIDYLSRLSSHRVAADLPLVRRGATQAVVRAAVVRDERRAVLEVEINPGKSNRARVNRGQLPKARELLGLVRTVIFAPDDLALVKGDPTERRSFADDLLVLHRGRGTPAPAPTTTGCSSSATRCSRPPGSAAPPPRRRSPLSRCGTSGWRGWGRRSWPRGAGWSTSSTRCSARPTRRWPGALRATTRL